MLDKVTDRLDTFQNLIIHLEGREDKSDNSDCYACLIPIMKAALEKVGPELDFESLRATFSANLFDQFQTVSQEESWKNWIDEKVNSILIFIFQVDNNLGSI